LRQYVASAQVTASWNIFNGFQTYAEQRRAAITARMVDTLSEQAAAQVSADIVRARETLVRLTAAFDVATRSVLLAEEGARLAAERLEEGTGTLFDVREANLKLTLARVNLASVRLDLLIARADLQRAVGGPY
jgi:outer membrane protein TolC